MTESKTKTQRYNKVRRLLKYIGYGLGFIVLLFILFVIEENLRVKVSSVNDNTEAYKRSVAG